MVNRSSCLLADRGDDEREEQERQESNYSVPCSGLSRTEVLQPHAQPAMLRKYLDD